MRNISTIILLTLCLSASAQDIQPKDTTNVYLDKFEAFVSAIELNDSTIDWGQSNSQYKALRMEYRNVHKKRATNDQITYYNNLKARYLRQVSLKKVGKGIKSKAQSISSAVKGAVEGVVGK